MRGAVYNLPIPNTIPNSVHPVARTALSFSFRFAMQLSFAMLGLAITAGAVDWSGPEQQLALRIVAVTGPGAIALTVENRSSLGKRDSEIIQNGLRSALGGRGIRFVTEEQSAATVAISLSENPASYVWVAEIRQGTAEVTVVMVSAPRPAGSTTTHESVPISLRRLPLWTQDEPILDVAVLEENPMPTRIAVLDPDKVSLYRLQVGKWQQEQTLGIVHARPWPRDLRGRLVPAKDGSLDVYLPGVICHSATQGGLSCREADDPWPLVTPAVSGGNFSVFPGGGFPGAGSTSTAIPAMGAFFASTRNFFTGALTPGVGKITTVSKFYSAAWLPREKYVLWLFASTDGRVHLIDGMNDQVVKIGWGSDVATVKTSCGAGWQVLATAAAEGSEDSVRAYEFPDRDPVAVSAAVEFTGAVTALWTEARGGTAIAVVRNRETGSYEAFRLAVACSQ